VSRLPALLLAPVALRQAAQLRRDVVRLPEAHGARDGLVGSGTSHPGGRPFRLLVVGDSTAVGTGVATVDDALPGRLARLLAATPAGASGVAWRAVGRAGATSAEVLADFGTAAVAAHFDLAVVLVGWNDALQLRSHRALARDLSALLDRLHDGSPAARLIVIAPPEFSVFTILPQPLRWALGRHTRGLTQASTRVAKAHDAALAPGFTPHPDGHELAADRFHPNGVGYQRLAEGVVAAWAAPR
jgi:lysophospholipase L1-like esterase